MREEERSSGREREKELRKGRSERKKERGERAEWSREGVEEEKIVVRLFQLFFFFKILGLGPTEDFSPHKHKLKDIKNG